MAEGVLTSFLAPNRHHFAQMLSANSKGHIVRWYEEITEYRF